MLEQGRSEKFLKVEKVNFLIVPSALMMLKVAHEYLRLCRALQSVAVEAVQRLTHLFKLFNRQMLQLVLQGEAKTNKVLKKVTATNIALCSQTCGMFTALIPRFQEQLQRCLLIDDNEKSIANRSRQALLADFGRVTVDFTEHHGLLLKKLSEILESRYDVHAKKLFSVAHPPVRVAEVQSEEPGHAKPLTPVEEVEGSTQAEEDSAALTATNNSATESTDNIAGVAASSSLSAKPGPPPPRPQVIVVEPHEICAGLIKDVCSMYRVLLKVLSGENMKKIFVRAFQNMAGKFQKSLQEIAQDSNFANTLNAAHAAENGVSVNYDAAAGAGASAHQYQTGVDDPSVIYSPLYPWGDRVLTDIEHIATELQGLTVIATVVREWIRGMIKDVEEHAQYCSEPFLQGAQADTVARVMAGVF
eukprot:g12510.t1